MNYFELINKCLVELNYKKGQSFSDFVKNDHEKIKNILNVINAEVCGSDNWNFLLRKMQLDLPANSGEAENTVQGKIHSIYIDDVKYNYYSDFEKFLLNKQPSNTYSAFNDKLLFPMFTQDKVVEIIYYTNNFAQDISGVDIPLMTAETDSSIIPMPFLEPLLVYGTCMRFKGNPEYTKFNYWFGMYKEALANMRSKLGIDIQQVPNIVMKRG